MKEDRLHRTFYIIYIIQVSPISIWNKYINTYFEHQGSYLNILFQILFCFNEYCVKKKHYLEAIIRFHSILYISYQSFSFSLLQICIINNGKYLLTYSDMYLLFFIKEHYLKVQIMGKKNGIKVVVRFFFFQCHI